MKIPDPSEQPTLGAEEVADLYGCSSWSIYKNKGDLPVAPIRVGRSLRWPTLSVLRSLGLAAQEQPVEMVAGQ